MLKASVTRARTVSQPPGLLHLHSSVLRPPQRFDKFGRGLGFAPPQPRRFHRHVCMVLTESKDLGVGVPAPTFTLPDPRTGNSVALTDFDGAPAYLVTFICNHCPYVIHLKDAFTALAKEYQAKGVAVIAISSNSVQTHPQDGPELMAQDAEKLGYTFPYLYDETQEVAKAYKAACTPEFYVLDSQRNVAYHGQFDDSRPRKGLPITGKDLRAALDAVLAGQPAPPAKPSIGCNIKWHPGSEPKY